MYIPFLKSIYCTIILRTIGGLYMKTTIQAIKSILLPVLTGLLAGLLISNNTDMYNVLIKPPFALPGSLFPVVWTVLYILMGVAFFLFQTSGANEKDLNDGKLFFYTQLFFNFLWPIVFFNFKLPFTAFILLVILFVFTAITVVKFYQSSKLSGIFLLPYLLYILYAGYLNFAIWFLNL